MVSHGVVNKTMQQDMIITGRRGGGNKMGLLCVTIVAVALSVVVVPVMGNIRIPRLENAIENAVERESMVGDRMIPRVVVEKREFIVGDNERTGNSWENNVYREPSILADRGGDVVVGKVPTLERVVPTLERVKECLTEKFFVKNWNVCRDIRRVERCDEPHFWKENPTFCDGLRRMIEEQQRRCIDKVVFAKTPQVCLEEVLFTQELQRRCSYREFYMEHNRTCEGNLFYYAMLTQQQCNRAEYRLENRNNCEESKFVINDQMRKCEQSEYFSWMYEQQCVHLRRYVKEQQIRCLNVWEGEQSCVDVFYITTKQQERCRDPTQFWNNRNKCEDNQLFYVLGHQDLCLNSIAYFEQNQRECKNIVYWGAQEEVKCTDREFFNTHDAGCELSKYRHGVNMNKCSSELFNSSIRATTEICQVFVTSRRNQQTVWDVDIHRIIPVEFTPIMDWDILTANLASTRWGGSWGNYRDIINNREWMNSVDREMMNREWTGLFRDREMMDQEGLTDSPRDLYNNEMNRHDRWINREINQPNWPREMSPREMIKEEIANRQRQLSRGMADKEIIFRHMDQGISSSATAAAGRDMNRLSSSSNENQENPTPFEYQDMGQLERGAPFTFQDSGRGETLGQFSPLEKKEIRETTPRVDIRGLHQSS